MKREYTNEKRMTVIETGRNVFLPYQAKITVPKFTVGDHTRINGPVLIRGQEDCSIGKYCALGYNITIVTTNHDIRRANIQVNMHRYFGFSSLEISKGPVRIGNSVWIGDNVTILSGANIGDGCVVGAGAVVADDLPPCSIALGAPAKVSRYRFDPRIIEQFLALKWWDWPEERIARNRKFFEADLTDCGNVDLADLIEP